MRPFKFRAWDTKEKYMDYIDDFYWFEEEGVHDSSGEGHDSNYILMQFTGLKDINGVDIYEGDIIIGFGGELCQGAREFEIEGVITFSEGCFWIASKGIEDYECSLLHEALEHMEIQVIGNVFEDGELLK